MAITAPQSPWLLLVFTLPAKRASERVEVWRRLQRYGAQALRNSGYIQPNNPTNRERFEWLATSIRNYKGEASVLEVHSIDNLSFEELANRFTQARSHDYQTLLRELSQIVSGRTSSRRAARLSRLRRRFQETVAIDFFHNPMQERAEELLTRAEAAASGSSMPSEAGKTSASDYRNKVWVTRPRPEIDRVASAWLIKRCIDSKARFAFADSPHGHPKAIPFDMFQGGFGHRDQDCTFETLVREFRIRERRVRLIGQIVHDADLYDEKYGSREGFGLDEVLKGWARQGLLDSEILRRGMEMFEGLYQALARRSEQTGPLERRV